MPADLGTPRHRRVGGQDFSLLPHLGVRPVRREPTAEDDETKADRARRLAALLRGETPSHVWRDDLYPLLLDVYDAYHDEARAAAKSDAARAGALLIGCVALEDVMKQLGATLWEGERALERQMRRIENAANAKREADTTNS